MTDVSTTVNKRKPELIPAREVPVGQVYSWGVKTVSYLRVDGGSVCLTDWHFVPTTHGHFSESSGPQVEVADSARLHIVYEG